MAPRKVRLIVDLIRGQRVDEAERRLSFLKRDAVRPVYKLLQSAIANAEHNFKLSRASLFVKSAAADGGPTLKRFMPRAMGRAAPIRKRTTHVTIVLTDEPVQTKAMIKKEAAVALKALRSKAKADKKAATKKTA